MRQHLFLLSACFIPSVCYEVLAWICTLWILQIFSRILFFWMSLLSKYPRSRVRIILNPGFFRFLNIPENGIFRDRDLEIPRDREWERAKEYINGGLPIKIGDNLNRMLTINNTIWTSTSSVEMSFSAMNRIATNLRSKIDSSRLEIWFVS